MNGFGVPNLDRTAGQGLWQMLNCAFGGIVTIKGQRLLEPPGQPTLNLCINTIVH